jgi:hypothetical protein
MVSFQNSRIMKQIQIVMWNFILGYTSQTNDQLIYINYEDFAETEHQGYNQSIEIQHQIQTESVDDLSNLNMNTIENDYLTLNSDDTRLNLRSKSKRLKEKPLKKLRQKPINSELFLN